MFTAVRSQALLRHKVIIIDDGATPWTVESYLLRQHARFISRKDPSTRSAVRSMIRPDDGSFPDFKLLYVQKNFRKVADSTEKLINIANENIDRLRLYLRTEGGTGIIRIKDSRNRAMLRQLRCILLPTSAMDQWGWEFRQALDRSIDHCLDQFPLGEDIKDGRIFLFQHAAKRIPTGPKPYEYFQLPLWKMEALLRRWRADKGLEEWGEQYQNIRYPE